MKRTAAKILPSLAFAVIASGIANGDVLYHISSFNNNNSTASTYWIPGITDIMVAAGVTGTDDAGLFSLQTLRPDADTATSGAPRFRNTESGQNNVRETVTTDASTTKYFQFGITADPENAINLTSLSFEAVRATTGTTTRGYNIDVSINGGAYTDLGAANVANQRNDGLEPFSLPITDTGIASVDFRVFTTGGGVEYTNFVIDGTIVPGDADDDGLLDGWEDLHFGNGDGTATPAELALQSGSDDGYPTPDGDLLDNNGEEDNGTDPNVADSDSDGLNDGPEVTGTDNAGIVQSYGATEPLNPDTDGDGLMDGDENPDSGSPGGPIYNSNPNLANTDSDSLADGFEVVNGLDPGLNADDQDEDTFDNITEILNGSSPTDGGDTPANTDVLAGTDFTVLPWLNTGGGVTPDDSSPLLPGAAECGLLNNNAANTGAMASIASTGGVVYYSVDLRFTGALEAEGINILIDQDFRTRTSSTSYASIRIQADGSLISHDGPGAAAGTIVSGNTYTCQFAHDITTKRFSARIYDRTNSDTLIYDAPITATRNQDTVLPGDTIYFGAGLQSNNTDAYELCMDNLYVSTAPIVPGSVVIFPPVSDFAITKVAFVGADLEVTFSPGGAGYILTSSDDLSSPFTEETNATYDDIDTFTVPAASLNPGKDFFRVETTP